MRNVLAAGLLSCCSVLVPVSAGAATCDSLRALKLTNVVITTAQVVDPGRFLPPGAKPGDPAIALYRDLPSFCRAQGVIQPSSDSHIEFEVWLPTSGWNKNFMGIGNGGAAGSIIYDGSVIGTSAPGLAQALKDGFATASTDTGHQGRMDDYSFGRGHPERRIDYYYRAIHETAVTAKAVIRAFYGEGPKFSYFSGCSFGGRQALTEVQRYPDDYDGVIAGAPAVSRTALANTFVWVAQALSAEPGSHIPEEKPGLCSAPGGELLRRHAEFSIRRSNFQLRSRRAGPRGGP
jgi:feruloyl esterase